MEVFCSPAGQFRFTFLTHSIANAGPEEFKGRISNDGHIDEGVNRRLIEVIIAGKGLIFLVHDGNSRRRSAVRRQGRESKEGFIGLIGNDLPRIDGPAAADTENEICLLNGFFFQQAIDVFKGGIVAIPQYVEDFEIRFGNGIEERLFSLGQSRLTADDDDFFPKVFGDLTDGIIGMYPDGKSRQNQGVFRFRHSKTSYNI